MAIMVLAQGSDGTSLSNYQQQMYAAEANQPEGTQMQLVLNFSNMAYAAAATGTINVQLRQQNATRWPGNANYAYRSGSQVTIQWVKEGVFIEVILYLVKLAVTTLGFVAIGHWIFGSNNTSSSTGSTSTSSGGTTSSPPTILGTANNLIWVAGGIAVAWVIVNILRNKRVAEEEGYE